MANPLFLVENLLSPLQFPAHVLSADEEATGFPVSRIARASRLESNHYESTTPNAQRIVKLTCDQLRGADMLALDRNTNLRGEQVFLEGSQDDFATAAVEIFDITIPTAPGGHIDDANGLITEELVWLKRFDFQAFTYWWLRIPAMGAGLVPQIGGLWLGRAWQMAGPIGRETPHGDDDRLLAFEEVPLESGWRGASSPRQVFTFFMLLELEDDAEYEQARYHLTGQYGRRRPMWVMWDPDIGAERTRLYVPHPGQIGMRFPVNWPFRAGEISGVEHEPLLDGS